MNYQLCKHIFLNFVKKDIFKLINLSKRGEHLSFTKYFRIIIIRVVQCMKRIRYTNIIGRWSHQSVQTFLCCYVSYAYHGHDIQTIESRVSCSIVLRTMRLIRVMLIDKVSNSLINQLTRAKCMIIEEPKSHKAPMG